MRTAYGDSDCRTGVVVMDIRGLPTTVEEQFYILNLVPCAAVRWRSWRVRRLGLEVSYFGLKLPATEVEPKEQCAYEEAHQNEDEGLKVFGKGYCCHADDDCGQDDDDSPDLSTLH